MAGLVAFVVILILYIAARIKIKISYRWQMKIMYAIYLHSSEAISRGEKPSVKFSEMDPYRKTIRRIRGGYKRILPYEKYKIVEPYIKLAEERMKWP